MLLLAEDICGSLIRKKCFKKNKNLFSKRVSAGQEETDNFTCGVKIIDTIPTGAGSPPGGGGTFLWGGRDTPPLIQFNRRHAYFSKT